MTTSTIIKLLLFITIFIAAWVGIIRPWLRPKESMKWFFGHPVVEWVELNVWRKSESLMWARWLMFLGTALTTIGQIDPTMITTIAQFLPEGWQWIANIAPMAITVAGVLGERLRRDTTKPLELVAVTEKEKEQGPVSEAIEAADAVNKEAVQVVEAKKD